MPSVTTRMKVIKWTCQATRWLQSHFTRRPLDLPPSPWQFFSDIDTDDDRLFEIGSMTIEEAASVSKAFQRLTPDDIAKIPDLKTLVSIQRLMDEFDAFHLYFPVIQRLFDFIPTRTIDVFFWASQWNEEDLAMAAVRQMCKDGTIELACSKEVKPEIRCQEDRYPRLLREAVYEAERKRQVLLSRRPGITLGGPEWLIPIAFRRLVQATRGEVAGSGDEVHEFTGQVWIEAELWIDVEPDKVQEREGG